MVKFGLIMGVREEVLMFRRFGRIITQSSHNYINQTEHPECEDGYNQLSRFSQLTEDSYLLYIVKHAGIKTVF